MSPSLSLLEMSCMPANKKIFLLNDNILLLIKKCTSLSLIITWILDFNSNSNYPLYLANTLYSRCNSLHFFNRCSTRGLPRIIVCLCLVRLDNSSRQARVVVCKRCIWTPIYKSIKFDAVQCAEDDYLQSSRHNIPPQRKRKRERRLVVPMLRCFLFLFLSVIPLPWYSITMIHRCHILHVYNECLYHLYNISFF